LGTGNRIATALFYLSKPDEGGFTVRGICFLILLRELFVEVGERTGRVEWESIS